MARKNKYGLSASRPKDVDEKVRRRCGYGCVICGCAIYDYHHFDPPFSEAKEHDPNGITLLCGKDHDLAHSGLLPVSVIREANQNPKCLEDGFSHAPFYIGQDQSPIVIIGEITFIDTPIIVEAFDEPLIQIEQSEEGTPFQLSGVFYDSEGNRIFEICQNELHNPIGDWDIEVKRPRIIIRRASGEVALQIYVESPRIVFEKIDMFYEGFRIIGEQNEAITLFDRDGLPIYVISPSKTKEILESIYIPSIEEARQKKLAELSSEGQTYINCEAGVILRNDGKIQLGRECESLPLNSSSILLTG